MATILITRPQAEAEQLACLIKQKGFEPLIQSVFEISFLKEVKFPSIEETKKAQALIFTSKNGVRAFAKKMPPLPEVQVFTVGVETARLAKEMGFQDVKTAGKDVEELKRLLQKHLHPSAGKIWYIVGRTRRGQLEEYFKALGCSFETLISYETHPILSLKKEVKKALKERKIDFILFFSPQTAQDFVTLLQNECFEEKVCCSVACCLSKAVAEVIQQLKWKKVLIARHPTQKSLLEKLFQEREKEKKNGEEGFK